jgi:hypothetical protein
MGKFSQKVMGKEVGSASVMHNPIRWMVSPV